MVLILAIEIALAAYFFYVVLYNLLLALAGKFRLTLRAPLSAKLNKIAVLIPSYKEDSVILDTAREALEQSYPADQYQVIVIADQLKAATVAQLKSLPLTVVEAAFEKSTKVNSLNKAMQFIGDNYDIGVILDADNLMDQDFLLKINKCFNGGYMCIQGQRKPKNSNSDMAVMDGLSEDINNNIVRKGTCVWGGSSAIVGSGFAVQYSLLKTTLAPMDSIGGFDKELEIKLLQQGVKTVYLEEARLYDEKVAKDDVFVKQRKRWISSQYFYLRKYFATGIKALLAGNFSLFNSTVLRYIQLPRLLNLGLLFIIACLSFLVRPFLYFPFWIWPSLFLLLVISILLSVPASFYSKNTLKALFSLPRTFMLMFLLLFKLKGANKNFIHTPHGVEPKK